MTQTIALIIDAYRDLNARKLFWISLFITVALIGSPSPLLLRIARSVPHGMQDDFLASRTLRSSLCPIVAHLKPSDLKKFCD